MSDPKTNLLERRELLLKTVPACAIACAGLCSAEQMSATTVPSPCEQQHKFDVPRETPPVSSRQRRRGRWAHAMFLMGMLRNELGEQGAVRLLSKFSEVAGTQGGQFGARNAPNTEFEAFVAEFRPPNMADQITQEIVEDSEKVFEIRVTECVHAEVFKQAGVDGELGHAAVCYRDFFAATAFNPNFRLERTETLMQGHEHCNHRWVDLS